MCDSPLYPFYINEKFKLELKSKNMKPFWNSFKNQNKILFQLWNSFQGFQGEEWRPLKALNRKKFFLEKFCVIYCSIYHIWLK